MDKLDKLIEIKIQEFFKAPIPKNLPTLSEVVYTPPNPDESRKYCGNCFMWSKDEHCLIFSKDKKVVKYGVCNYHIYGKSKDVWISGAEPLNPKLAGFLETKKGTSCDICNWYNDDSTCSIVVDEKYEYADVQLKGCCSRWQNKI